jgi:transposase-like protein
MTTDCGRRLNTERGSAASSYSEDKWKIYCYSRKSLRMLRESIAALSRVAVVIRGDFAGIAEL